MFDTIVNALKGRKTHIVAIAMLIFAISGIVSGQLSQDQAITLILQALGLSALRVGVSSK